MKSYYLMFVLCLATVSGLPKRFIFPSNPFGGGPGGNPGGSPGGTFGGSPGGSPGGSSGGSSGGYHACTPSQLYCNMQCPGGYVKGPGGCDFCFCDNRAPVSTTAAAAPSTTPKQLAPTIVTSTKTAQPMKSTLGPEVCAKVAAECHARCGDGGYLVDPTDCTFCLCKNSIAG